MKDKKFFYTDLSKRKCELNESDILLIGFTLMGLFILVLPVCLVVLGW